MVEEEEETSFPRGRVAGWGENYEREKEAAARSQSGCVFDVEGRESERRAGPAEREGRWMLGV